MSFVGSGQRFPSHVDIKSFHDTIWHFVCVHASVYHWHIDVLMIIGEVV